MKVQELEQLRRALDDAEAVIVGAGAGLSAAAGYDYGSGVLERYFPDFVERYGFQNLYEASFFPFREETEYYAFWSRCIYLNRYVRDKIPVYPALKALLAGKDHFVITTNVDHCFQKAGFEKARLFYTQGDYGLWQCPTPCHQETYDNEENVLACVAAQGFRIGADGDLEKPEGGSLSMRIPKDLIPRCPRCGKPLQTNLRVDDRFVQDAGWYAAHDRYAAYLKAHETGRVLYLDLGSGMNTPVIFKYPFMNRTWQNPDAVYAAVNLGEAFTAKEIADRSICVDADLYEAISQLLEMKR